MPVTTKCPTSLRAGVEAELMIPMMCGLTLRNRQSAINMIPLVTVLHMVEAMKLQLVKAYPLVYRMAAGYLLIITR